MRKLLLLPGNGILIYHVPAGPTAPRAGNSTCSSFARGSGEAAPANYPDNHFSATSLTGPVPAVNTPVPDRLGKTLLTRMVSPAGPSPAGKIVARQPVSTWRKRWLRWSILMPLLPAAARLNNLVHADDSIITLMHQRRCTYQRRRAYCCLS